MNKFNAEFGERCRRAGGTPEINTLLNAYKIIFEPEKYNATIDLVF